MNIKHISVISVIFSVFITPAVFAKTYSSSKSALYAKNNVHKPYSGSRWRKNPFLNVSGVGGNCTNFANQSIAAGLFEKTTPRSLNNSLVDVDNKKLPKSKESKLQNMFLQVKNKRCSKSD
ncbi:MAG TPA: hypothetical protein EYH20_08745 [Leucothrix sp.]|nr:hypothetical protein [Leucothrix sp.]